MCWENYLIPHLSFMGLVWPKLVIEMSLSFSFFIQKVILLVIQTLLVVTIMVMGFEVLHTFDSRLFFFFCTYKASFETHMWILPSLFFPYLKCGLAAASLDIMQILASVKEFYSLHLVHKVGSLLRARKIYIICSRVLVLCTIRPGTLETTPMSNT